jgi:hypothetical protein
MATRAEIKKDLGRAIRDLKEVLAGLKSMQPAVMNKRNKPIALAMGMGHGLETGKKMLMKSAKALAKVDKKLNRLRK